MATNALRGGLGLEKFFRRKSSSTERTKEPEKNVKSSEGDAATSAEVDEKELGSSKVGKFFSEKDLEDKNDSADNHKTVPSQMDDVSSQKTTESKKTSKKKKPASALESPFGKPDDKPDDSEACKEYIIKDDVGQVKLTDIINNSIKEAVLSIVKEGVRPLADSLDLRAKDTSKKSPSSVGQETHDKENKPGSPKPLLSLLSGANKTFDSHLCQSQYQRSSQISPRSSWKLNHQQERVNQSIREVSPRVNPSRKLVKCPKQKDKRVREASPKISRQTKGQSSHFKTDNRRMTGNVNIYICSEANENAKGKKKPTNAKECNDDSESASGTAPSSALSISTSKLVAALRKKQGKNLDNQSLSCVCEPLDSSVKPCRSYSKIGDGDPDDLLCLCDKDSNEVELPDTRSTSSRDICLCKDPKFSDLDFPGSDEGSLNKPFVSATSCECIAYDRDEDWPCTSEDCASYDNTSGRRRFNTLTQGDNAKTDLEERRSYCDLSTCNKERPIVVPCTRNWKAQHEHRKSRDRTFRMPHDTQKFDKCLCIVEEEDENCCNDRKKSEEKFTVCGIPSAHEQVYSNTQKENDDPANSPSGSRSNILRKGKKNNHSPKAENKNSVRTSRIASASSHNMLDKKEDPDVEGDINSKPQSPKPTLISTLKKNFKRSSGKKNQESKPPVETTKEEDQVKNSETDEKQISFIPSTGDDDNVSAVPNEKPKASLFYRSIQKAMDIVKIRKDNEGAADDGGNKNRGCSPECQAKPKNNSVEGTNGGENKNGACGRLCNGIDQGAFSVNSGNNSKQEKRSKSRISTAIASRRSSATTSNESSNVSLSHGEVNKTGRPTNLSTVQDTIKTQDTPETQGLLSCKCGKLSERSECRCKKPEPPEDETCTCYTKSMKTSGGTRICCKPISPRKETCVCCPKCENPVDKCICCSRKPEIIEPHSSKCCPRCSRPIPECKCCCSKQETLDHEFCKCCLRQKNLCCCNPEGKTHANKSQVQKCGQPRDFQESLHQCNNCCRPKTECSCCQTFSNWECPKSMICMYCDEPQENCTCKAPIRKCSQCGLPLDVCNCKPVPCCDCSGRQIVQAERNEAQTICVTAWKPRRSIRRYFARETNDVGDNSEEECACYEKTKPYGSERLPYQKGSVFSNVMSELQEKMSGSMCCNICRNVPCNCCTETNDEVERRPKQRLSTIPEKRSICRSRNRSRSKSPVGSCKCSTPRKKSRRKMPVLKVCDRCRTSPCRCRRSSVSPQNKPPARCYYCKSLPCICAAAREPANMCPYGKADSSHRRRKVCSPTEEYANADVRNEDNGHRGRGSKHVVSYPGNQQLRKYCYRGNPTGEHTLNSVERVR